MELRRRRVGTGAERATRVRRRWHPRRDDHGDRRRRRHSDEDGRGRRYRRALRGSERAEARAGEVQGEEGHRRQLHPERGGAREVHGRPRRGWPQGQGQVRQAHQEERQGEEVHAPPRAQGVVHAQRQRGCEQVPLERALEGQGSEARDLQADRDDGQRADREGPQRELQGQALAVRAGCLIGPRSYRRDMRRALVPLIVSLVVLANASAAAAKEWCIAPASGCADGNVATFQSALDLAKSNAGPDQIRLGAAMYDGPFTYDDNGSSTNSVTIPGAGSTATTLTRSSLGAIFTITSSGGALNSLTDIGFHITQSSSAGLQGGRADTTRVAVAGDPAITNSVGLTLAS